MGIEQLPIKPGSSTRAVPGSDVRTFDPETGAEVPRGELGAICIKLPMPPSCFPTLWNAPDRYREAYMEEFPGYSQTGDAGYLDEDGYIFVMTRNDDIINVAGHRLSTGAMEEVLADHPDVAECAVIGVADQLKGQLPLGLICLYPSSERKADDIIYEAVDLVRSRVGRVAALNQIIAVDRLPKTRSGKVLRGTVAKIADGTDWTMPATIDDPVILDEITAALKTIGYAGS